MHVESKLHELFILLQKLLPQSVLSKHNGQSWAVTLKVNPARLQREETGLDVGYIGTTVNDLIGKEPEFKCQSTAIIMTNGDPDITNAQMMSLIRDDILQVLKQP